MQETDRICEELRRMIGQVEDPSWESKWREKALSWRDAGTSPLSIMGHGARGYAAWALAWRETERKPRIWHVDSSAANAGTNATGDADAPFASIGESCFHVRPGDTVSVRGGVYRECVAPCIAGKTTRPIRFEAAEGEEVIVTAADPWAPEWEPLGKRRWAAGFEPLPWDDARSTDPRERCEQIFLDGTSVDQVADEDGIRERDPVFWIEHRGAESWIVLHLPEGAPEDFRIERSRRAQCWQPAVRGLGHQIVSGFRFVGGAAPYWGGANWHRINQMAVLSVDAGHHWTIENCGFYDGNAQGVQLADGGFARSLRCLPVVDRDSTGREDWREGESSGHPAFADDRVGGNRVRGCRIDRMGISGIVGLGCSRSLVVDDCVVTRTNRKKIFNAEEAGIKLHGTKGCLIRGNRIAHCDSHGLWLDNGCGNDRITQNIFVDNRANQIMFEMSPGPLLVDNNVVIESREENPTSTGFYTHDGNRGRVVHNVFVGGATGVRLRALFHREHKGKPTTTRDHLVANNVFDSLAEAPISLMPSVPRSEDHHSDGNLFWQSGREVRLRMENSSDVGLLWEETRMGRGLGYSGGGSRLIPLDLWAKHVGEDRTSLPVAALALFGKKDPEAVLEWLKKAWQRSGHPLDGGYVEVRPTTGAAFWESLFPEKANFELLRTIWLTPDSGVQVWKDKGDFLELRWQGNSCSGHRTLASPFLSREPVADNAAPVELAIGEEVETEIGAGWRVRESALETNRSGNRLRIVAGEDVRPGRYRIVLANGRNEWKILAVQCRPALSLESLESVFDGAPVVSVTCRNTGGSAAAGSCEVRVGENVYRRAVQLEPKADSVVEFPIEMPPAGAARCKAKLSCGKTVLEEESRMSFVPLRSTEEPAKDEWFEMDAFPEAVFPPGAEWSIYYKGNLHARFRVLAREEGLAVDVGVDHPIHEGTRLDMEGLHTQDAVKILIKGRPGLRATVVGMTLHSETGEESFGFCKSCNEDLYPIGRFGRLPATIRREENRTLYSVTVPWDAVGREGRPEPGGTLALFDRGVQSRQRGEIRAEMVRRNSL